MYCLVSFTFHYKDLYFWHHTHLLHARFNSELDFFSAEMLLMEDLETFMPQWRRNVWPILKYGVGMFNDLVIPELPECLQGSWVFPYSCCIRSCKIWSSVAGFWISCTFTCILGCGVVLWIMTSKPLMTVFPLGFTLPFSSSTETLGP